MCTLTCLVLGEITPFQVTISETQPVDKLKDEIKRRRETLNDIDAVTLRLYKIKIDISDSNKFESMTHDVLQPDYVFNPKTELSPTWKISKCFPQYAEDDIHILVETPRSESIDPRAWVPSLRICSSPPEFTLPCCLRLRRMSQPIGLKRKASASTISSSATLDASLIVRMNDRGSFDHNSPSLNSIIPCEADPPDVIIDLKQQLRVKRLVTNAHKVWFILYHLQRPFSQCMDRSPSCPCPNTR